MALNLTQFKKDLKASMKAAAEFNKELSPNDPAEALDKGDGKHCERHSGEGGRLHKDNDDNDSNRRHCRYADNRFTIATVKRQSYRRYGLRVMTN